MEKQTIVIRKIRDGQLIEKKDEVALEESYGYVMQTGEKIEGTCTPTYVEEMILGSRFLKNDLTVKERESLGLNAEKEPVFKEAAIPSIFDVAERCFEIPGSLFADTGCAHSCALVYEGKVMCQMEDIGRYNALDKSIGYALMHQIPLRDCFVFASGRISKEYLTKAIKAGFPMVVSRAAVTKAAVDIAKKENVTLVGFIRKNSGNIYHEGNVKLNEQSR